MARQARDRSPLKVYHAILRGVNKQQIFECTEDYEHFVRILQRQCGLPVETRPTRVQTAPRQYILEPDKEPPSHILQQEADTLPERHCYLYAWCLMGNHVHLLIKESDEPIGDVMKRISSSYVFYYNHKYDRVGHLFQERFKSQPVDDWTYFLTLLRYIHQNPLKPQLVHNLIDYPWSSWLEYTNRHPLPFSSTQTVLNRIPLDELTQLVNDLLTDDEEQDFLDVEVRNPNRLTTDEDIWQELTTLSGATNATEFQALPRPQQKHYLYLLHEQGAGPRTLSRLTGVPYSIVQRATSKANEQKYNTPTAMVCESTPEEDLWQTYLEEDDSQPYPDY